MPKCENGVCEIPFGEEVDQESICEACGQDCENLEDCLFSELD